MHSQSNINSFATILNAVICTFIANMKMDQEFIDFGFSHIKNVLRFQSQLFIIFI